MTLILAVRANQVCPLFGDFKGGVCAVFVRSSFSSLEKVLRWAWRPFYSGCRGYMLLVAFLERVVVGVSV